MTEGAMNSAGRQNCGEWFSEARFGLFIHWGPYAAHGRGEQVLFREHLDQAEYTRTACEWNPQDFDAAEWARTAVDAGFKYAVLTTRHHDGYCLWDSRLTDYTSARQAPRRDFVREYVNAFRSAGLRVGLYYSLADWRIPAYWDEPGDDTAGWARFLRYVHGQIEELLTGYGQIDVLWFDGAWPHDANDWKAAELVRKIRALQPDILINNRLGSGAQAGEEQPGASDTLGDFGTPEHQIVAEARLWESCQVTTWRLWGFAKGEQYRSAEQLLDFLCACSAKGGNLLLNVGPDGEGRIPEGATRSLAEVGQWLRVHGEAIYGAGAGDLTEFTTYGYQTWRAGSLFLIYRFWPHCPAARLAGIHAPGTVATILSSGAPLNVLQNEDGLVLEGLPVDPPCALFPVIRLDFAAKPEVLDWARDRLWQGDPRRMISWSRSRGNSVWTDGSERPDEE